MWMGRSAAEPPQNYEKSIFDHFLDRIQIFAQISYQLTFDAEYDERKKIFCSIAKSDAPQ